MICCVANSSYMNTGEALSAAFIVYTMNGIWEYVRMRTCLELAAHPSATHAN